MTYEEEEVCTILWCVCGKVQEHGDYISLNLAQHLS